jgi:hypothetical protein
MIRSYMNMTTGRWTFMEYNHDYGRWFPHAATMRAWCDGAIRVYRPADNPNKLITMPGSRPWPLMTPQECCSISTADVPAAWVPTENIVDYLNEADIPSHDAWIYDENEAPALIPLAEVASSLLSNMNPRGAVLITLFEPAGPPPPQPNPQPQPHLSPSSSSHVTLPPHVVSILIKDAIGSPCPITMEPLTDKNAAVTSCGHVFERSALHHWFTTGHTTCPQCRQPQNMTPPHTTPAGPM